MNNLNSILIEGNLVRDPLLRSTPKGTQVCSMCLASNRYYKQDTGFEKEVSFFDVETWSKLAEACYAKGKKGRGVRVVGRLKQSRWSDPEGKSHSRVTIVAEHVEFRPEFKKDVKPATEISFEDDYEDEENGEAVMAMEEKEVEAVAF
ncbi:single-stranded DNA-binding protein [Treponema sp. R6D11]